MRTAGLLVALALAVAPSTTRAAQDSPVTKVIELIQEMKEKIKTDGTAEQKVYDEFACWCEKTLARKGTAIDDAKVVIERQQSKVFDLKGELGTVKAEVDGLTKDLAGAQDSANEATEVRAKETNEYQEKRDDLEQAIGALERAITILTGAGEKTASALQEAQVLGVAKGLEPALSLVAHPDSKVSRGMDPADRAAVEAFVVDPVAVLKKQASQTKHLEALQAHSHLGSKGQQKGPFGDYAQASGAIQGILKGMYDSFTADLESKNADEAKKQKDFEGLLANMKDEIATLEATLGQRSYLMAAASKSLADATMERDETTAQMEDDTKFFADTKDSCKKRAEVWSTRSRLRTEELAGVMKALEILTGPEAAETFGKSFSMLLQSGRDAPAAGTAKMAAYNSLKALAGKTHSLRLAAMAAKVHASTGRNFDMVVTEIDKMLEELRTEQQDDINTRDYCQDEENKVFNEIDDLQHTITQTEGLIERLESKKKTIEADITQTEADMAETEDAMAEAVSNRNAENEDFKTALKDDLDSAELLSTAIDSLSAFYKNNKLPLGLVQQRQKRGPEYSEDPDKMPDNAMFEEPYGGRSSEGGGILSILGYLKEDIEKEIGTSKAAEAKSLAAFEESKRSALKALNAMKDKKASLELQQSETMEDIAEAETAKDTTGTIKEQKEQYQEDLKPKCEWIKGAFETRRDHRQDEMTGLLKAKNDLAGGGGFIQAKHAAPSGFMQRHGH